MKVFSEIGTMALKVGFDVTANIAASRKHHGKILNLWALHSYLILILAKKFGLYNKDLDSPKIDRIYAQ